MMTFLFIHNRQFISIFQKEKTNSEQCKTVLYDVICLLNLSS